MEIFMEYRKNTEIQRVFEHCGIVCRPIGESWLRQEIFCAKLGYGPRKIVFFCDYSPLSLIIGEGMTDWGCDLISGEKTRFFNRKEFFSDNTLYLVPRPNPDGIDLAQGGISAGNPFFERVKKMNPQNDFSHWRGNIRGVDLSLNHDCDWRDAPSPDFSSGGTRGDYPESEKESAAVSRFLLREKPDCVFLFSKGNENGLCCTYQGDCLKNSARGAKILSGYFGIPIVGENDLGFHTLRRWILGVLNIPCMEMVLSESMQTNLREIFSVCGVVASCQGQ